MPAVFGFLEDVVCWTSLKILAIQKSDCKRITLLINSYHPLITKCNPSISFPDSLTRPDQIPIIALPFSTLFLSLSLVPSLLLLSHTQHSHTHKKIITTLLNLYGNSKSLILWQREGEMLAAIKPQNCSMSNPDP